MRILVVDDAEESREIIEAALISGGYRDIATAASGWAEISRYRPRSERQAAGRGHRAPRHHDAGDRRDRDLRAHPQRSASCRYADHHGDVARRYGEPRQ